jgi:hypothetical protein
LKKIFPIFLLLFFFESPAQNFIGPTTGNYSGNLNQYVNPANINDSKTTYCINLAAISVNEQTNYARWAAPFSLLKFGTFTVPAKYKNTTGDKILWYPSYFDSENNKKQSQTFLNGDGKGPFFSYQNGKIGIGGGVRYRYFNSITNTSKDLSEILIHGTRNSNNFGVIRDNNSGNLNSSFINQYTLSLGTRLPSSGEDYFKIGLNLNYFLSNNFINYKVNSGTYIIKENPTDYLKQDLTIQNLNGEMNIASNFGPMSASNFTNQMGSLKALGSGFGIDLGLIYEKRSTYTSFSRTINGIYKIDNTAAEYDYKIGVSITDLARLTFKNNTAVNQTQVQNESATIYPMTYPTFDGFERVATITSQSFGLNANPKNFKFFMPTTLHTTFDWHVKDKLFLNFYYFQNLTSKSKIGPVSYSGVFITPRFESKFIEVSFPMGLSNDFQNFNLGLNARFYSFFVGSDNLTGILNLGNPRAISVYSGVFIPIYQKTPKSPLKCYP